MTDSNKYQTNIKLYPFFRMVADCHAWIAVFFLYMSSVLSMDSVIQLSAIYYLSVFLLEVPSGYFSDCIGRRITLLLAVIAPYGRGVIHHARLKWYLSRGAARSLLTLVFQQKLLTNTNILRCDFDQFIVVDKLESLLQCVSNRLNQD